MGLIGEFEITCDALPFVGVVAEVPEADTSAFSDSKRPAEYLRVGIDDEGRIASSCRTAVESIAASLITLESAKRRSSQHEGAARRQAS